MNQEELEAGDENLLVCTGGTGVGPCKVEKLPKTKAREHGQWRALPLSPPGAADAKQHNVRWDEVAGRWR